MFNYLDVLVLGLKIIGVLLIIIGLANISIVNKKNSENK